MLTIYSLGLMPSLIFVIWLNHGEDNSNITKREQIWFSIGLFLASWATVLLCLIFLIIKLREDPEEIVEFFTNFHKNTTKWSRYHIQSKYLLTPLAIIITNLDSSSSTIHAVKMVYIFGVRVARIHLIL